MVTSIKENLKECILWATLPFENGYTYEVKKTKELTVTQQREHASIKEKEWGNRMIGQKNNGNWTTHLGEGLVYEVLNILGENPRKPDKKSGYEPDWETDGYIYEVKTRNWTTTGTAGDKVPGVMYKYSDIPELYGKPLRIVCVGYQEWELTNCKTKVFGEVSENKRKILDLVKSMNIEYLKFSDLASKIDL